MPLPLISVVIPVPADTEALNECLQAVLRQSYDNVEVVLVSEDGGAPTLPEGTGNVRVLTQRSRQGLIHLINTGLRSAKGGVKVLLMPHCVPEGDRWLEELVKPFDDEAVGAVVSQCATPDKHAMGLAARLLHGIHSPQLRNTRGRPVELELVSGQCDAYRAGVLAELGYLEERSFPSPGDAADLSIRIARAGYQIVLSPTATAAWHDPPEGRSLGRVLSKALDFGHADAVLGKAHNMDWLGSRLYTAALLSLLLLPVGFIRLPVAVILAAGLFAWGWFLPLRLPVLRWEWPVALLNLAFYIGIVLAIRPDWAPGLFDPRRWHPAIIRQWCILAAMTGSYMLILAAAGLSSAVWSVGRCGGVLYLPVLFLASTAWWAASGVGYLRGMLLGRAPKAGKAGRPG